VQLTTADTAELAALLPLGIELEPYRERLTPLAVSVLSGESRRTIDKHRELVLPDVWDGRLRAAALDGVTKLRAQLERLAEELQALAVESASSDAGSDLIWIQACLGLTLEAGLGLS
jgi:hypothetical protein